jgi:SAM-dependent methyltransferase
MPTSLGQNPECGADVAANYRYWQEHGGEWAEEYAARKRRAVKYHVQEIMLTDYVAHHAPAVVLEFGCGVGRHLRNLSRLPGVEVYGYDQSPSMVACLRRWTGQEWIDTHVALGPPTGPLPYADGQFDIVFTTEVLVHVRPEDLEGILRELMRICRGHLLHLEPSEHVHISDSEHEGCWKHDLLAAYARLGRHAEILPSGYFDHVPTRVVVGQPPAYTWSPVVLELFRTMETELAPALYRGWLQPHAAALYGPLEEKHRALLAEHERISQRCRELECAEEDHRALLAEHERISQRCRELECAEEEHRALLAEHERISQRCRELEQDAAALRAALAAGTRLTQQVARELKAAWNRDRLRAARIAAERDLLVHQLREILQR